ncbi:MAG: hypothetical protein WC548_01095 [Candidatus Pacearchaeota archaeon]
MVFKNNSFNFTFPQVSKMNRLTNNLANPINNLSLSHFLKMEGIYKLK